MAKLYFRYGAMGSSKSANILMVRYNYEERGQYAILLNRGMVIKDILLLEKDGGKSGHYIRG